MSPEFDLFVSGRPSLDLMFSGLHGTPAVGEDIEADGLGVCAGTSFNTPAAANRLGMRVAYLATVGNDVWSRMIRDEFEAEGLPTDYLLIEDRPLPGVSVAFNLDGDRGFVTHWGFGEDYDANLRARVIEAAATVDARHLHTYVDEAPEVEAIARDRGMTVSLDAWGGHTWSSPRSLPEILSSADVLLSNAVEATAMTGEREPGRALEALAVHCGCVVIKLGAAGAIGSAGGRRETVPAEPVKVVDTTGAGDAFNAGFLAGWLRGIALKDSLTLGVICGGGAVGDYGGYRGCPSRDELRAIAASRGIELPAEEADEGARRR
jgi:sugar/nucleoside kinase (ribokinase family)